MHILHKTDYAGMHFIPYMVVHQYQQYPLFHTHFPEMPVTKHFAVVQVIFLKSILEWIQALYATKLNEYICIAVKACISRKYLVFTKRKNTTKKLAVHPFLVM